MASGDVVKGSSSEVSNLMNLVGKASEDLRSQSGRISSNLSLVRNFGETVLANGIIDDRKYLVSNMMGTSSSLPSTNDA